MVWDRTNRPAWLGYTISLVVFIIAAVVRWQLSGILGFRGNFVTFYPAVTIAALHGGFRLGLPTTIASALLANLFWIEPAGILGIPHGNDLLDLILFLAGGILISYLVEMVNRGQARAHKAEQQLKFAAECEKTEKERKRLIQVRLDLIEYALAHKMDELLSKALDEIGAIVESPVGFYQFVERDQKTLSLQQWSTQTLSTFCKAKYKGRHYSIDQAGVWADCIRQRRPVIHNDYGSLENKKGIPEGHVKVVRELVVPVMREGRVVAVVGVGNRQIDYTEKDAETVTYLADVTWEIIERKRDEEKIRQNEITLRTVLDQLPLGVTVRDASTGGLVLANVKGRELAGTLAEDTTQFSHYRGFYPDGRPYRVEDWPFFRSMTTGEMVEGEELEYERADGVRIAISMSSAPIRDPQGQIIMSGCVFNDIAERKRAEQRLRESEALLVESEKISHLGSWSFDLGTNRLTWSDEVYRIFGLEPGELDVTYEAFLDAVHPEDRKAVEIAYSRSLLEKQSSFDIEFRIIRKHTGEVRYVQGKCVHQCDAAGTVIRSVGMVLDITERKIAENALRESQTRLHLALRSAGMGTWHWDVPANTLCFDEQACHLLGMDPATFSGTQDEVFRVIHADDHETIRGALGRTIKQDVQFAVEHRSMRPDGRAVHIAARGKLVRDDQGRPERLNGLIWDITERKQAEEQVKGERKRLFNVLEALPVMICLLTPDYHVAFANRSFRDRFGESKGRHCYDYCFGRSEPCDFCETYNVLETGLPHHWQVPAPDGSVIDAYDFPFTDVNGSPLILEMDIDITERMQMENELRKSRDELELRVRDRTADLKSANEKLREVPSMLIEAQERERQRLSMELHDSVGQTIAALKFRIEHVIAILEREKCPQALHMLSEFVPVLQRSLDETRTIYMGLKPTILAEFGILATLEWYRQELVKVYPNHHIELETSIREADIPDNLKIAIFRIAQEALNNALKHGKPEWVDVRLALNRGVIELEISDDGVGMDLNFILESRTAKSLGLIGMRERAELTGGEFSMRSAPHEGTTVKVDWRNL